MRLSQKTIEKGEKMEKIYSTSLAMPSNYVAMDENTMEYVEGGKSINLDNSSSYLSRSACQTKAKSLKEQGYCVNMSQTDVAKEIHAHAVILYMGAPAAIAALALGHGLVAAALLEIASHGADGIYLGDDLDSSARVAAYNAVWILGRS